MCFETKLQFIELWLISRRRRRSAIKVTGDNFTPEEEWLATAKQEAAAAATNQIQPKNVGRSFFRSRSRRPLHQLPPQQLSPQLKWRRRFW
jgi:hypothetical protein